MICIVCDVRCAISHITFFIHCKGTQMNASIVAQVEICNSLNTGSMNYTPGFHVKCHLVRLRSALRDVSLGSCGRSASEREAL